MTNLTSAPTSPTVSAVISRDPNGLIGRADDIPWHYPDEMNWYTAVLKTCDFIVMGYNTYMASFGIQADTIVLDRDGKNYCSGLNCSGSQTILKVNNIESILKLAKTKQLLIAGGLRTFNTFLPYIDLIHLAEIKHKHEGDKYFTNKLEKYHIAQQDDCVNFTYKRMVRTDG